MAKTPRGQRAMYCISATEVMLESKETQLQLWVSCTATRASEVLLHTKQGHAKHSQAKLSGVWCVQACKGHDFCIPVHVVHLLQWSAKQRSLADLTVLQSMCQRDRSEKALERAVAGFCLAFAALCTLVHPLHNMALLPRDLKYRGRHAAAS